EQLIAPGVVNTMPEATIHAFADHGVTEPDTVTGQYEAARKVFADLEAIGVDFADVVDTIEREGVEKFIASWNDLLGSVSAQLGATS
ncbi:MAG TPA: transaldolase family protein, partial [Rugosimonospora sp.]|nr:transaldolase family protein [Rugosimonospora sp.]